MGTRLLCFFLVSCTSAVPSSDAGSDVFADAVVDTPLDVTPQDAFVDGPFDAWQDTLGDRSLYSGRGFAGTRSPDGEGYCCPYNYPDCNCFNPGSGFAESELACVFLGGLCDAEPDRFREVVDEHGCTRFEQVPLDYEPISCRDR